MYENRHINKAQDQPDLALLASADTIFNSKVDRDDVTQLNWAGKPDLHFHCQCSMGVLVAFRTEGQMDGVKSTKGNQRQPQIHDAELTPNYQPPRNIHYSSNK